MPLYLYKRIKYHEYVVDISLMNKQYFIVCNEKQYDRLIEKFEKYEGKNNRYNKNEYRQLIILNEYIIIKKKLVKKKKTAITTSTTTINPTPTSSPVWIYNEYTDEC